MESKIASMIHASGNGTGGTVCVRSTPREQSQRFRRAGTSSNPPYIYIGSMRIR
jgi:hypothetical protein